MYCSKLFDAQNTEEEGEKRKTTSRQNSEVKNNVNDEDDIDEPLLEKEKQDTGTISASVYLEYFKSGGNICTILLLLLLVLICQGAATGAEYFVTYW